jgi:DNA-binding MarR family transcriptional regulator
MELSTEKEIVALLAILVKKGHTQTEVIAEFDKAGFGQKRIAELVGTTPNTVNVTLNALKKKKHGK